jgi:hypothetical protein
MTNQVVTGRGVNLIYGTTVFGEIQNVSEIMETIAKIDTTSHNNTGAVKTYRPGFSEIGELTVEVGFTGQSEQAAIATMKAAGTISTWQIVAPCSAITYAWSFQGYVSGSSTPTFDKDGNSKMTFKIQPTGQITAVSTALAVGVEGIAVTDANTTALTLSPTFAATTYGYQVTTDLADTGVKFCISGTGTGESIYVNNALATAGETGSAITIPTTAGQVIMIPVVKFKTACVPKVYWVEVTHGYV